MEEGGGEDDKENFKDGIILDQGVSAEPCRPEEVGFTEDAAEDPAEDAEYDKDQIMHALVGGTVVCLK